MNMILRLISEDLSTLPVKISFPLGRKHGVCTAVICNNKCDVMIYT